MRRICGGDGFGVRRAKRSAFFLPKSQMKDPESIAGKIMLEYSIKAVSYVHMQISAPWHRQNKKILNPRIQPPYCPSLDAETCTLT